VCNIFNTNPSGLYRSFDRPLHYMLQGDVGVTASEAHQHVLSHRMCQSAALLLHIATDSLLQLGYLCPSRVKMRKHDASFWCCLPGLDRVEAEGRQGSIHLAQEPPDKLRVASTRRLEMLQPLPGDGQLQHLMLCQLPLPRRQSSLLVP
jgi:hypothetical protein